MLSAYSLFVNALVLWQARRSAEPGRILPLIAAGFLGVPIGARLLVAAPEPVLRIVLGAATAIFAAALLWGLRIPVTRERLAMVPVGLFSGIMNGAGTLSGPPVVIFQLNQGTEKEKFRATLASYFLALNMLTLPVLGLNGLLTREVFQRGAGLAPSVLIGTVLGLALATRIRAEAFRRWAMLLILVLGLFTLASGMGLLT